MYIGVDINYGDIASQTATSTGSTTPIATLDYSVPTSSSIIVTLDGVTQVPGVDFNVTSGTTLTFTSSVPSGVVVCVYFLGRSVDIGTPGSGTVDSSAIVAGAVDDTHISGLAASKLTGTVAVANGGTGAATHTANNVLIGNGTSAITSVAPSTSGNVLTSNGSAWTSSAPAQGGKVLNIYHVAQKGEVTTTSTSPVDLAGMTLTTGSLATVSSKLLISVVVYASNSNVSRGCYFNVYANSTLLDVGDHSGSLTSQSRVAMFTGTSNTSADGNCAFSQFFYSPNSTAAQTIKVKWWVVTDTGQLNRSQANGNDAYRHRDVSSIIVQEISS